MSQVQLPEVFTVDELARATAASRDHLSALVASGQIRLVPGTPYIAADEAIRIGRQLRRSAPATAATPAGLFEHRADGLGGHAGRGKDHFLSHGSSLVVKRT